MVGTPLPYDNLDELRGRLAELSPALVAYGDVQDNNYFAQANQLAQVYTTKVPMSKILGGDINGVVLDSKNIPSKFLKYWYFKG